MSNNNITYRTVSDYLIPNLELPAEEKAMQIGIWGIRRKNYLIKHNLVLFNIMLADGTLWNHLAETDKEAEEMFSQLVNEMTQAEGVNEKLKAEDQMAWVQAMNVISIAATEIVTEELINA